jgi:thiol-disulfide isomerase/thioredoxin
MEETINDQLEQNHSPDKPEPETSDNSLHDSLQRYEAQRAVLEKILETIPVEARESANKKHTNKQSILQRMKRKLHLILLLAFVVAATLLHAQNSTRGTNSIIFQEDFNGWTNASFAANGWSTITSSSNFISAQDNQVNFFKQVNAQWMLLIMPGLNLANANMLIFDYVAGSSVVGMKIKIGVMTDTVFLSGLTGTQYLAFNVEGPIPYTYLFMDNVIVAQEESQANWPMYVTNLNVVPQPNGVETAMVSWKNPSKEADGGTLTDLDSVVVEANQVHAYTLNNPVIGANVNVPVDVPSPGFYVFTVTAYNTAGASSPITSDTVWVGLDTPGPVQNLVMTVVNDSTSSLSWSPPLAGAHGAFYNGVVDSYRVIRADGTEFNFAGNTLTFSETFTTPGTYNYTVIPVNYAGDGTPVASNAGAFYFQNFLLYEDFWVDVPAFEWEENGDGTDKEWYMSWAQYTGGVAPEAFFWPKYWQPFTGTHRMISPVVNTEGKTALSLDFLYYVDWINGTFNFKVETSSDNGVTWHTVWNDTITQDVDACDINIVIQNQDVGSPNFRFAYTFEGYNEDAEILAIDAIRLYPAITSDIAALALTLPDYIRPGDVVTPLAEIKNFGYEANAYTAVLTFSLGQDTLYKSTISSSLAGGQVETLTFENWTAIEGDIVAQLKVICPGDLNPGNNILIKNFGVYNPIGTRTLVVCEEFTGTWCAYCPGAAMGLRELAENNWPVAVVAYHRSDDFETGEAIIRNDYYNVSGYPTVMFDGVDGFIGGSATQSMYEDYIPFVQARMAIASDASVSIQNVGLTDLTLTANIILNSASPIQNGSLVLHSVLTETDISHPWQNQDKVDFAERAMYQGAYGTPVDLSDKTETVPITFTLSPSWNKEKLEIVTYLQDTTSKEVINGNKFSLMMVGINEPDVRIEIYPNPASEYFRITAEAQIEKVELFNSTGQLVVSKRIDSRTGVINVAQYSAGLYIVRINTSAGLIQRRIIVN